MARQKERFFLCVCDKQIKNIHLDYSTLTDFIISRVCLFQLPLGYLLSELIILVVIIQMLKSED